MKPSFLPCAIVAAFAAIISVAQAQNDKKPAPVVPASSAASVVPAIETLRDPEVVKIFSAMPVQANGRVKPLDTVARFPLLLRMHGKQTIAATTLDEATGK